MRGSIQFRGVKKATQQGHLPVTSPKCAYIFNVVATTGCPLDIELKQRAGWQSLDFVYRRAYVLLLMGKEGIEAANQEVCKK
jgi:hypothetical protein